MFSILSRSERNRNALIIFILYFVITVPYVINKNIAKGIYDKFDLSTIIMIVFFGTISAIIFLLLYSLFIGSILHLILNKIYNKEKTFTDAFTLPILSLAPQLALIVELPFLIYYFGHYESYIFFLYARFFLWILTMRTFYWGLRILFDVSGSRALIVVVLPFLCLLTAALLVSIYNLSN